MTKIPKKEKLCEKRQIWASIPAVATDTPLTIKQLWVSARHSSSGHFSSIKQR